MAKTYVVRSGDTIESIAEAHGLAPDVLWSDADNAALRELRRVGNILHAGDLVVIPAPQSKHMKIASGAIAVFRRVGVPSLYRIRFTLNGRPRRDLAWAVLLNDGSRLFGTTDDDGVLQAYIHPSHKTCTLSLGDDEPCELLLGFLDPVETASGVQQRLRNLGFACPETGVLDAPTVAALRSFQKGRDLPTTGECDATTRRLLERAHGPRP